MNLSQFTPQETADRPVATLINKVADALKCQNDLRVAFLDSAKEAIPDTFAPKLSQEERVPMFLASLYNYNVTEITKSAVIIMLLSLGIIERRSDLNGNSALTVDPASFI